MLPKVQPGEGSVEDRLPDAPTLKVQFVSRGAESGMGEYQTTTQTVFLNQDDGNIQTYRRSYRRGGKDLLVMAAFALMCHEIAQSGSVAQLFLRGFGDDVSFSVALSKLLSTQHPAAHDEVAQ